VIDANGKDSICKVIKVLNRKEGEEAPQEEQFCFDLLSTFVVPFLN
jgi:hypothetical protein